MQILAEIYRIALIAAWPLAIIALVAAGVAYFTARQLAHMREELRKLRISLEHNPTPAQLGQGMRQWPDVAQFPGGLQVTEMVKRANMEENKRAERVEKIMGMVRSFAFVAFIGIALIVAGRFYTPDMIWTATNP